MPVAQKTKQDCDENKFDDQQGIGLSLVVSLFRFVSTNGISVEFIDLQLFNELIMNITVTSFGFCETQAVLLLKIFIPFKSLFCWQIALQMLPCLSGEEPQLPQTTADEQFYHHRSSLCLIRASDR